MDQRPEEPINPLPTELALAACDQIVAALAGIATATDDHEAVGLATRHLARLAKVLRALDRKLARYRAVTTMR